MTQSTRRNLFLILSVGCVAATVIFAIRAIDRRNLTWANSGPVIIQPSPPSGVKTKSSEEESKTLLYFRANALGDNYGKLAVVSFDAKDNPRYAPDLSCERLYFQSGKGTCLYADRGVFTKYYAIGFDDQLRRTWTVSLNGAPSRVRVSPSGHLASVTVFLSGHSYASLTFSTQTTILDTASGRAIADLDNFSVTKDGAVFKSPDFNFWGVTFARDENRFYATVWSRRKTYLIEGDLSHQTARVIRENVECPSLSPDNTRIAFKERMPGPRLLWQIHVLDLKTMTEAPTGESRNVDDQVEWLDNNHILYALSENEKGSSPSTDIWVVPSDPEGSPSLLFRGGFSPAVVRTWRTK